MTHPFCLLLARTSTPTNHPTAWWIGDRPRRACRGKPTTPWWGRGISRYIHICVYVVCVYGRWMHEPRAGCGPTPSITPPTTQQTKQTFNNNRQKNRPPSSCWATRITAMPWICGASAACWRGCCSSASPSSGGWTTGAFIAFAFYVYIKGTGPKYTILHAPEIQTDRPTPTHHPP